MTKYGRSFYKLSGSGNDFVFVDARTEPAGRLEVPEVVGAICARATGVGADGIVFIEPPQTATQRFSIRYLNRDGSLALLCGNASLCSVRLAAELGIVSEGEDFEFGTGAGSVRDSMSVMDQLLAGATDEGVTYAMATSLLGYTDGSLLDSVVQSVAVACASGATL